MARPGEERAFARRRAEQERVVAAAAAVRGSATQASYAGFRGAYVGYAVAALLDSMSRSWEQLPDAVRRDALAVAGHQLDGPDGPNDPRTVGRAGLSDGRGH
ncbi:MAG: hypothetical protein L0I76_14940 [Pseudonocardia sp.]|nr:hypothetical protein [Pseudonocardia sp.]